MSQLKSEDIELKPCPFCGSINLDYDGEGGFISCKNCLAYGPDCTTELPLFDSDVDEDEARAVAKKLWNKRVAVAEPPVIPCEFPDCNNPADYEGWYRKRDQFLGTPTGHIVRIAFCESCKSHPHLCVNEKKPKKSDEQDQGSS